LLRASDSARRAIETAIEHYHRGIG
jgi:hypothetical protein